jgi:hypothetical protein
MADEAVQELVRSAITDRFLKDDIPDQNLVAKKRPVLVLRDMPSAGLVLGSAALPNLADVSFALIARDAVQAQANTTGQTVFYVFVDRPAIVGDTATLLIGVDLEGAHRPEEDQAVLLHPGRPLRKTRRPVALHEAGLFRVLVSLVPRPSGIPR